MKVMKWLRNATWSNRGDFRECFGWWQLRSGHNYIWIHRQKVAKTIQVQRLWKEAHHPWPRFSEWPVINFTFKRRFICTTKGVCRIRVQLFCNFWIYLKVISYLLAKSLDLQCIFWNATAPSVNSVANTI